MTKTKMLTNILLKTLSVFGVFGLLFISSCLDTHAAGVALTISPSTANVSSATTPVLSLTTTIAVPVSGTIQVVRPTAAYSGTASLAVSAGAVGGTVNTTSGSDSVSTVTVTTIVPVGALNITVSGLTTSATAGNYPFKVYTSVGDYGANFQYVGQANVVTIRARVALQLGFVIRDTDDANDTNTCDMGDLSLGSVGFCEYRLKVTTNARNGYTINVTTSGGLTNGSDIFTNAAAGSGGTGGTTSTAGTESYGVVVTKGSVTGSGGTTTLASTYNGGASKAVAYNNTGSATLITANKPNNPGSTDLTNTTLIRHEAAISTSTVSGSYTQLVTYTIAPSF